MNDGIEELTLYRALVRKLIESGSTHQLPNSSPKHAAIIIEEMVRHAKDSFVAVSDCFDSSVWGSEVVQALVEACRKGVSVGLLAVKSAEHIDNWDPEVRSCVRRLSDDDAASDAKTANFAVMDKRALRLETDKSKFLASFFANNAELAGLAFERFGVLKGRSVAFA